MARPHKTGLDYFSHDCDLSNDEKIESIEALYQNNGYAMFLKLLERIYRNGGELDISAAETQQILCQKCGINSPETFQKMLLSMVNLKLFDKNAFEAHKILTSDGIKKRCEYVVSKRVKEQSRYKEKVSAVETPPETGESKVKESKVKNIYIHPVLAHFNQTCKKNLTPTPARVSLIKRCLDAGRTEDQLKTAITNFSKDDWAERHKYIDLVYAIGVIRGIDNFDKWFNQKNASLVNRKTGWTPEEWAAAEKSKDEKYLAEKAKAH